MKEKLHNEVLPDWFDVKKLNEVLFCEQFLEQSLMKSINGTFFTVEGRISDENKLKKQIYDELKPYITSGISKKVTNLLDIMRVECYSLELPIHRDRLHVSNGTLFLDEKFIKEKDYCRNRLPIEYNPNAMQPEICLHFLSELLEPEDS